MTGDTLTEVLYYVEGVHPRGGKFVCGCIFIDGKVTRCAPLIAARGFRGETLAWVQGYCDAQGWTLTKLQDHPNAPAAWEAITGE